MMDPPVVPGNKLNMGERVSGSVPEPLSLDHRDHLVVGVEERDLPLVPSSNYCYIILTGNIKDNCQSLRQRLPCQYGSNIININKVRYAT